jgi:hypothetical protein
MSEKLAGDFEYSGAVDGLLIAAARDMGSDIHAERPGNFVEIATIEKGVRQTIDEAQRAQSQTRRMRQLPN